MFCFNLFAAAMGQGGKLCCNAISIVFAHTLTYNLTYLIFSIKKPSLCDTELSISREASLSSVLFVLPSDKVQLKG